MDESLKIGIIGSGNVASYIAHRLHALSIPVSGIYARNNQKSEQLAKSVDAPVFYSLTDCKNLDLLIISVKDDAIKELLKYISDTSASLVHTSGSTDMQVFADSKFQSYGIFYPLQTFHKNLPPPPADFPLLIEANNKKLLQLLVELGKKITGNVFICDSEQRKKIHLAAVFASNFSNCLYSIAEDILRETNMEPHLLYPLIRQTSEKAKGGNSFHYQTGPAYRGDKVVQQAHLEELKNKKEWQNLYRILSAAIEKKAKG